MTKDDISKADFCTHHGHFEYKVMSFGLCNVPSTFQATMNDLLRPFLQKFVAVFFNDILVFSLSLLNHLKHLKVVITTLSQGQFFLCRSKCLFA